MVSTGSPQPHPGPEVATCATVARTCYTVIHTAVHQTEGKGEGRSVHEGTKARRHEGTKADVYIM